MDSRVPVIWGLSALLIAGVVTACSRSEAKAAGSWSRTAAAAYLDQRADWWMGWQRAARDHGTFCVSCHTALPYALSRAALRDTHVNERRLLDNDTKRVRLWKEVGPYYSDQAYKATASRG